MRLIAFDRRGWQTKSSRYSRGKLEDKFGRDSTAHDYLDFKSVEMMKKKIESDILIL